MMNIIVNKEHQTFHLFNDEISYVMMVLPDGHLGQLYYGSHLREAKDWRHLLEIRPRSMASHVTFNDPAFSHEHIKDEYETYGQTDYRMPAVDAIFEDGSHLLDLSYKSYKIVKGKPSLTLLPSSYAKDQEAMSLIITLEDSITKLQVDLYYIIFEDFPIISRYVTITNNSLSDVHILKAMSICLDLPDDDYEWMQFSGAWARERKPIIRTLTSGITSIGSLRGHSSHNQNPFVILKRPNTDEISGTAMSFSFVYSGNFIAQCEVDSFHTSRFMMGIHPQNFDWCLASHESFKTPEVIMSYTSHGLNDLSQCLHNFIHQHITRGPWHKKVRPILLNSWEACYFELNEKKLLQMAKEAKSLGIELFVIDDGWFTNRHDEKSGLGDWIVDSEKFPNGFSHLISQIKALGLNVGLWIEPEMVNEDSLLYQEHPDYILAVPDRPHIYGRYQQVLDFSKKEVVDLIYTKIAKIIHKTGISYIKWDMNRSISQFYSQGRSSKHQGEIAHRYILGVYDLFDRLTKDFPNVLFESCASGGARFDLGMLYYSPQIWTSDDTDAYERLKIQYGTSFAYPISAMGTHVSASPNHQTQRNISLRTRGNVAYFGTFGYELDPTLLSDEEKEEIKGQISFMKKYRSLLQFGSFYRLSSPFDKEITAWIVVDQKQEKALVGYYRPLNTINGAYTRVKLLGLDPQKDYAIEIINEGNNKPTIVTECGGDELMAYGLITSDSSSSNNPEQLGGDFDSRLYLLTAL